MDDAKRQRLEAAGWVMGDYGDFLGLTEAERQQVELRLALCRGIRELRAAKGLTQSALGKMIDSTQSRIAKVESGTTIEVSLDLMFRAYFALGGTLEDLTHQNQPVQAKPETPAPEPKSRPKRLAKQGG
jgi:DNA-binding XRE family transcriptional regulator